MSQHQFPQSLPTPCIIHSGILVNKDDIQRLLSDLGRVRYIHTLDNQIEQDSEGYILQVFSHPQQATLIANHALYLNVQSFDYLQLSESKENQTYFDLIQENRRLRLIPLSNPLQDYEIRQDLNDDELEAMMSQVLSAKWDVQLDDEDDSSG